MTSSIKLELVFCLLMAIIELKSIGKFNGGISSLKKEKYNSGILFINYMDIFKNTYITDTSFLRKYNANNNEIKRFIVNKGDVLFTASSETSDEIAMSSVYLSDKLAIFNGFSKKYTYNQQILNPKYASYLFRSKNFRAQVKKYATGYTRYNISQENLEKIKVNIPSIYKQQQIIDIIEPLEKVNKILNLLFKKIMFFFEKHYNLTDGNIIELKKIAKVFIGGTPSTQNNLFWNGKTPWINSGKLTNNLISKKADKNISDLGLIKSSLANKYDVLFSIIEPDHSKVSFASEKTAFNQSIARIESNKKLFFEIRKTMNYFKLVKNGAAQQSINKNLIENALIKIVAFDYSNIYKIMIKANEIINYYNNLKLNLIKLLIN